MSAFAEFEAAVSRVAPRAAVVLGSGLGPVVDKLKTIAAIDFSDVPGFAAPTVRDTSSSKLAIASFASAVTGKSGR